MIRVELPLVPSLNGAYVAVGNKRVPSKEHVTWKRAAGWQLQTMKLEPVRGAYKFLLLVPKDMKGDVSNRPKLAEDLFVELKLTPDDRHATETTCRRDMSVPRGRCVVEITEVTE